MMSSGEVPGALRGLLGKVSISFMGGGYQGVGILGNGKVAVGERRDSSTSLLFARNDMWRRGTGGSRTAPTMEGLGGDEGGDGSPHSETFA